MVPYSRQATVKLGNRQTVAAQPVTAAIGRDSDEVRSGFGSRGAAALRQTEVASRRILIHQPGGPASRSNEA